MNFHLLDIVGAIGAGLILLGFYRTSIGKWTNRSIWYELDNLAGATLLMIYNLQNRAFISVTLDIIWIIVAFRGITSINERRVKHKKR